ncbi:MAG: hypothetical protein SYC29_15055 [Planctomycetota bacterium]|nr:hypothetical protein [Planctomycetota bacterium]
MDLDITIQPECRIWCDRAERRSDAILLGHPLKEWQRNTRTELGLPNDTPVIATGHQTLLWHPGILVKYLLCEAVASACGLARANLIVDQHAGGFGAFEIPVRRSDDSLAVRRIELTAAPAEVPMALHEAFTPPAPPVHLPAALPSVAEGVQRIHETICAHREAPNAALQMASALADLMRPWVSPMPNVTATDLVETSLSRALLAEMAANPQRCAEAYNRAVAARPDVGIAPLLVREDYVELPLWRIRSDGRRMHAYDNDVQDWLERAADPPRLMPRALFMTALIRLGMCDLFVHGTGGANYDRAMELWIDDWLGVRPSPIAVATATLHLPLLPPEGSEVRDVDAARAEARRAWHDPEAAEARDDDSEEESRRPGPIKRELLEAVEGARRGSLRRREAFFAMHRELQVLRGVHAGAVERYQRRALDAVRRQADAAIATRRDWPFPLYPREMIDALAEAVARRAGVCEKSS